MQALTGSPRQSLQASDVTGLLQTDTILEVSYGALHLDSTFAFVADLSPYMSAGSVVSSDINATIHRSLSLVIDSTAPVDWVTDFVKPYMVLTNPDTGVSAEFFLGVYAMASPQYDNSEVPSVLTLTGYDLLFYLNQPINDSYEVIAGSNPVSAAITVIGNAMPDAVVQSDNTTSTLANDMIWPYGQSDPYSSAGTVTYLTIVNDLLAAAGFLPCWVDWNGVFQLRAFQSPLSITAEYTFNLELDHNIVGASRTSQQDLFDVPNYWRFIMANLSAAPVEGTTQYTFIDTNPNNPGSYPNRKRLIYSINNITAADYNSLVAAGNQQIATDLQPAETFTITTSPFPLAWHRDRIYMVDPNLSVVPPLYSTSRQLLCTQWSLPLDGQSDMSWTLQTVTT